MVVHQLNGASLVPTSHCDPVPKRLSLMALAIARAPSPLPGAFSFLLLCITSSCSLP